MLHTASEAALSAWGRGPLVGPTLRDVHELAARGSQVDVAASAQQDAAQRCITPSHEGRIGWHVVSPLRRRSCTPRAASAARRLDLYDREDVYAFGCTCVTPDAEYLTMLKATRAALSISQHPQCDYNGIVMTHRLCLPAGRLPSRTNPTTRNASWAAAACLAKVGSSGFHLPFRTSFRVPSQADAEASLRGCRVRGYV